MIKRQDLSCTYLSHHGKAFVFVFIIFIIITIIITVTVTVTVTIIIIIIIIIVIITDARLCHQVQLVHIKQCMRQQ